MVINYSKWDRMQFDDDELAEPKIGRSSAPADVQPTYPSPTLTEPDQIAASRSRSKECGHCGATDLSGKRLGKCTGCNNVYYCSEQCQRSAWKSHEKRCRRKSDKKDTLIVNDKVPNFDWALNYASKYMQNLKHVTLACVALRSNDDLSAITLTADTLQSFLECNRGQLESMDWWMNWRTIELCLDFSDEKTNEGQVWTELYGLKVLRMNYPVFRKAQHLLQSSNSRKQISCH